jgi:hypothetical protein
MACQTVPATNADFVPERDGIVARLRRLLAQPALRVGVSGGGLPGEEPQYVEFDRAVLIERLEVEHIITLLEIAAEGK